MIHLMCGISGSGKSTFVYARKNPEAEIICPDTIRLMLTGDISCQEKNKEVWIVAYDALRKYCQMNKEIYFDATSLTKSTIEAVLNIASIFGQDVIIHVMERSIWKDLCFESVKKDIEIGKIRANVSWEVIEKQAKRFMELYWKLCGEYDKEWAEKYKNINIKIDFVHFEYEE